MQPRIQLATRAHCWFMFSSDHQEPLGFPHCFPVHGAAPLKLQDSALHSLMNSTRLLPAHSSHLLTSPWRAARSSGAFNTPCSSVSPLNLKMLHFAPSSRSCMKLLNRTRPCTDSWDALLISGLRKVSQSLDPAVQPLFNLPHRLLLQPSVHQHLCENLIGEKTLSNSY